MAVDAVMTGFNGSPKLQVGRDENAVQAPKVRCLNMKEHAESRVKISIALELLSTRHDTQSATFYQNSSLPSASKRLQLNSDDGGGEHRSEPVEHLLLWDPVQHFEFSLKLSEQGLFRYRLVEGGEQRRTLNIKAHTDDLSKSNLGFNQLMIRGDLNLSPQNAHRKVKDSFLFDHHDHSATTTRQDISPGWLRIPSATRLYLQKLVCGRLLYDQKESALHPGGVQRRRLGIRRRRL